MALITFTRELDDLSLEIRSSLSFETIPGTKVLTSQRFYKADGTPLVFSDRIHETNIVLGFNTLTKVQWKAIEYFIVVDLLFRLNSCSITVDALDMGLGKGVTIPNCHYTKKTTQGDMQYIPPGRFVGKLVFSTTGV